MANNRSAYTIVVPVYNEAQSVGEALPALDAVLRAHLPDDAYEIVAVDDGSQDGSSEILGPLRRELPNLRVITHPENRGYGAALKTGIRHAHYDLILITDADGTYPPEHIPDLIAKMEAGYDMAVGARTTAEAHIPWVRRPAKWAIRSLASYLSGTPIPDLNSGLRAMRRDVVERFWALLPDGFSFTTTITLAMLSNSYAVAYLPIDYHRRGGRSKIKPVRDTLNFVQLVVRTSMYFNPLKVFLPLSGAFVVLGVLVGVLSRALTGRVMDVTSVVLVVTGVQILVTGMLADLIDKRTQGTAKPPRRATTTEPLNPEEESHDRAS
jgi:glycosyltransferase involved in cell wall biosynthesis